MIKVSIIIPIYNTEKNLKRCLDSVKNQTNPSFEVIMINDGSTDNSEIIAKKYLTDNRFHYLFQENRGPSAARNAGIRLAKGEWIAFLDSDDYYERQFIELLVNETEKGDFDIICCCCQYESKGKINKSSFWNNDCIFCDEKIKGYEEKKELYIELMEAQYKASAHRVTGIGVPWAKLYRASLIKSNNIYFDPRLRRLQDNIFNMYMFEAANKIKYIDIPLYNYDTSNFNVFVKKYNDKAYLYYDLICKIRRCFLSERKLLDNKIITFYYYNEVIKHSIATLNSYYLNENNPYSIEKRIKEMDNHFSDPLYVEAFAGGYKNIRNISWKIRIYLLMKKQYKILFIIYYLIHLKDHIKLKVFQFR